MSRKHWIISKTESCIEIANNDGIVAVVDLPTDFLEVVDDVVAVFAANGYSGENVLLAISSRDCLSARFAVDIGRRRSRKHNYEFLCYELEQHIPIEAEDVVADFIVNGEEAFAVALELDRWERFILALQEHKITIDSICPWALLACQGALESGVDDCTKIVIESSNGTDIISLDSGKPKSWCFAKKGESLCQDSYPIRSQLESEADSVSEIQRLQIDNDVASEFVRKFGGKIGRGIRRPWVQLARGPLQLSDPLRSIRTPLRLATVALVVLAIALSCSLWVRSAKLNESTRQLQTEQHKIFKTLMPNQPIPIGIRSRLRSEFRNLEGLSAANTISANDSNLLKTIGHILPSLPPDLRFRVLELRMDVTGFTLEGETRTHSNADQIASALTNDTYRIGPPTTNQLAENGVGFRIEGRATLESETIK